MYSCIIPSLIRFIIIAGWNYNLTKEFKLRFESSWFGETMKLKKSRKFPKCIFCRGITTNENVCTPWTSQQMLYVNRSTQKTCRHIQPIHTRSRHNRYYSNRNKQIIIILYIQDPDIYRYINETSVCVCARSTRWRKSGKTSTTIQTMLVSGKERTKSPWIVNYVGMIYCISYTSGMDADTTGKYLWEQNEWEKWQVIESRKVQQTHWF